MGSLVYTWTSKDKSSACTHKSVLRNFPHSSEKVQSLHLLANLELILKSEGIF